MELQDYIKLHKKKAEIARIMEEESSVEQIRTSASYTKEEHEELVSMLKELQRYRDRESTYLSNAIQEDSLKKNWQRASISEKIVFQNKEVMMAAINLQSCFKGSRFLTDREPIEFLADEKSNTFFVLGTCKTKEDVDCKVLEYISRAAYKTEPYNSCANNKKFHNKMLDGINKYLSTDFEEIDIETIYTNLGNGCNHEKALEFVRSEFDMDVFLKEEKGMEL